MKTKLDPCPFCGRNGKIILKLNKYSGFFCPVGTKIAVGCNNKKCLVVPRISLRNISNKQEENAIKAWNTRVKK